jgi:hypothetical protein
VPQSQAGKWVGVVVAYTKCAKANYGEDDTQGIDDEDEKTDYHADESAGDPEKPLRITQVFFQQRHKFI